MPHPSLSLELLIPTISSYISTPPVPLTPSHIPLPPSLSPISILECCLQCALSGFRCSFTQSTAQCPTTSSQAQGKKQIRCVRCWKTGQAICVLREKIEEEGKMRRELKDENEIEVEKEDVQWKYSAEGLAEPVLRKKVAELLAPAEEKRRWALPMASDWHRASLKPLSARFAEERKAEEARIEAFRNLMRSQQAEDSESEDEQSEQKDEGLRGVDQELRDFIRGF